jgi:hypothetical protein
MLCTVNIHVCLQKLRINDPFFSSNYLFRISILDAPAPSYFVATFLFHPILDHPRRTCSGRGLNPRILASETSTLAKRYCTVRNSVADPGCLSPIPEPDPDFYPSRISYPGSNNSVADPGCLSPIPDPDFYLSGSRISYPGFNNSVADPGCLSPIPDTDFYPSRIPYLVSNNSTKRGRGKIFWGLTSFCSHRYHKIGNNFRFEQVNFF